MLSCPHPRTEPRRRQVAGGAQIIALQCLDCGTQVRAVGKRQIASGELEALRLFDEDIRERHDQARREDFEADLAQRKEASRLVQEQDDGAWWAWYSDYLQSSGWRVRRDAVLARAMHICEGCGERPAKEVHHLTYEHVGREMLWELRAVCAECHEYLTRRSRARRSRRPAP